MKPLFFPTPDHFRTWMLKNHDKMKELWVGFHKRGSGRPSITWPESVDVALCFGWIDGVRKSLDEQSYVIRFTPRRPGSRWSAVNVKRVKALTREGVMHPSGLAAFKDRTKDADYSYEQREGARLDPASERQFRAKKTAWEYFQAQAPWYRRTATWWVISAKKEETRQKRLGILIDHSERRRPVPPLARPAR